MALQPLLLFFSGICAINQFIPW
ncbi:TPA: PhoP/PhoQ regulator MgrB [Escherichia coli]